MRRVRDVFYINANFNEKYFIYYGMEFKEFIKHNPIKIENILVTEGNYIANNFNRSWFLETANGKNDILELSKEDIYGLGNFHWLDYNNEVDLNSCTPEEKAEVLYLSHFGKPLNSPFFSGINNDFVYLSHDDGWFCKLYCKDMCVFKDIIANKIIESFSTNKRRKIYPMPEDIKEEILELTKKGLLIDFSNIYRDNKCISLNYYTIGHYEDMDEMYNNLERNKYRADVKGIIEHKNKSWKIQSRNN
ncbi:hypothetical protein B0P06_005785 [Clostridium saccharoperbutylacetonicum]|uniref:Uncharacterized protein n=1 Tax=Clostridium saccharoperbutylacetonicum N1-4(HMT) TaxID=931276 RepID=M1MDF7_9CLOT|nr:hypothetical protein [Clostridium saccharoperbutylacetonicum]AGF55959.1 hypothetical protein Cspa_c21940 [Clostridium saccharoperbutylacetonicum N1-4(HMT)]NRT63302.1 hypothetical protein [Clostridium saccharoperbutylacetonicum]NSB26664.1 hypothetical protein [Clostridium saccharoperbutylacetonicum]NSB46014.1 hypothetical protein [Clostridium saccharoperbutylacetonicum]